SAQAVRNAGYNESVTRKAGRIIGGSSGVKTAFSEVLHEAGVRDKRDTLPRTGNSCPLLDHRQPKVGLAGGRSCCWFHRLMRGTLIRHFHDGHDSIRADNSTVLRRGKAVKVRYCPATVR